MSCTNQEYVDRCGPYRSRHGLLFGVCAGLAEYMNLSIFWTRVVVLVAFVCTGLWPVGAAYLVAALLMRRSPYREGRCVRRRYEERARGAFDSLDARLRRMEEKVMEKARDWDRRLDAE